MDECVDNRVEQRALLGHVALCFVVAGALGFLGGGLAGMMHFADPSAAARYVMVSVCMATSVTIFWCSPNGPSRWRPFIISSKLAEGLFGGAAGIIVFSSVAALLVEAL
ncbi:MAG TPA: hypothetical protein VME45_15190 [Stellaceae bacterium]|nr:hypothetical protein [Stellaceae bacterium]